MSKYRISTNTILHGIISVNDGGDTKTVYTTGDWSKLVIRLNRLLEAEQNPKRKRANKLPRPSDLG